MKMKNPAAALLILAKGSHTILERNGVTLCCSSKPQSLNAAQGKGNSRIRL